MLSFYCKLPYNTVVMVLQPYVNIIFYFIAIHQVSGICRSSALWVQSWQKKWQMHMGYIRWTFQFQKAKARLRTVLSHFDLDRQEDTSLTWLDLTWLDLTWLDLTWLDLTWLDLTWLDLTWLDLTWLDLTWLDLTWLDLTWLDLTWLDLTWLDLTWLDLTWLDLTWLDLTWLDLTLHYPTRLHYPNYPTLMIQSRGGELCELSVSECYSRELLMYLFLSRLSEPLWSLGCGH